MHLVCFIVKNFVTMLGHTNVKKEINQTSSLPKIYLLILYHFSLISYFFCAVCCRCVSRSIPRISCLGCGGVHQSHAPSPTRQDSCVLARAGVPGHMAWGHGHCQDRSSCPVCCWFSCLALPFAWYGMLGLYQAHIQGVPGGMCNTSGECSLC